MEGSDNEREKGKMYVTLGDYLQRQKTLESVKPRGERRKVPTVTDLANAIGVSPLTLRNIVNNRVKLLNLELASDIADELRRRGFRVETTDIVEYRPPQKTA